MENTEIPSGEYYSPQQIAIASFIGSPIAACWFWAQNYRAMGWKKKGAECLVWGILSTIGLCIISLWLPETFPAHFIPLAYTFAIFQGATHTHGEIIGTHLAAGGRLGPWGKVIWISLLILAAVVVALMVVFPPEPENVSPAPKPVPVGALET